VTKADLVDEISGKTRISKSETATIVDQLLNAISRALSEGKHIEIRGFGTFKVRERKARKARNPRTRRRAMGSGKKRKRKKIATHKRKKRLRRDRHKKKNR